MGVKMSDLETLQNMMVKADINFSTSDTDDGEKQLSVEGGYIGFVTHFSFDKAGALKSIEAYE